MVEFFSVTTKLRTFGATDVLLSFNGGVAPGYNTCRAFGTPAECSNGALALAESTANVARPRRPCYLLRDALERVPPMISTGLLVGEGVEVFAHGVEVGGGWGRLH